MPPILLLLVACSSSSSEPARYFASESPATDTGDTRDTADTGEVGDTADTVDTDESGDTGVVDTADADTGDTGTADTGDTGTADTADTDTGRPCEGITVDPTEVHFPNTLAALDVAVVLDGCATGITTADNMIASGGYYDDDAGVYVGGTQYHATWESVPASVDGTVEVTLRVTGPGDGGATLEGEMYLDVSSDQGTTRVTVYVAP